MSELIIKPLNTKNVSIPVPNTATGTKSTSNSDEIEELVTEESYSFETYPTIELSQEIINIIESDKKYEDLSDTEKETLKKLFSNFGIEEFKDDVIDYFIHDEGDNGRIRIKTKRGEEFNFDFYYSDNNNKIMYTGKLELYDGLKIIYKIDSNTIETCEETYDEDSRTRLLKVKFKENENYYLFNEDNGRIFDIQDTDGKTILPDDDYQKEKIIDYFKGNPKGIEEIFKIETNKTIGTLEENGKTTLKIINANNEIIGEVTWTESIEYYEKIIKAKNTCPDCLTDEEIVDYLTIKEQDLNSVIKEKFKDTAELFANDLGVYYCIAKKYTNITDENELYKIATYLFAEDLKDYELISSTPIKCNGEVTMWLPDNPDKNSAENNNYEIPGDYLMYRNPYGVDIKAPLSTIDYNEEKDNLYLTPMGTTKIKEYINNLNIFTKAVINNSKEYPYFFKKYTTDYYNTKKTVYCVEEITIPYFGETFSEFTTTGRTSYYNQKNAELFNSHTEVWIKGNTIEDDPKFAISTYNHELGHVFSHYLNDFDESHEWVKIFEQVEKNDSDYELLRRYAHGDNGPGECFAEVVAEYLEKGNGDQLYNPNDLKALEIDVDRDGKHFNNLYDYIDYVLKEIPKQEMEG